MPGIFGLSTRNTSINLEKQLNKMQGAMNLYPHFVKDSSFANTQLAASRVHLGKIGEKTSPIELGDLKVWVEGEAYNLQEVADQAGGLTATSLGALLLDAEKQGKLSLVLNKLDGYFCAALYNPAIKKIKLISDRYGMRVLYWYFKDGLFAWGSGVKAILAVNGVDKKLDQSSYECFMDLGYLMGEHTWFEQIKLLKPATVLEYDLVKDTVSQGYYWTWGEIKPSNLSFDEAVDKLGKLFIEAVARRFNPSEKIGISLSGGLDSRAIFAAINHLYPDYEGYAYTFGIPGCDDITIAKKVVSRSKNWKHGEYHFSNDNWFKPRFPRVWNTDGMKNMMHMHGSEFLGDVLQKIDINLNGFLGDANLGGSYLSNVGCYDKRIDQKIAQKYSGKHARQFDDEYFNIGHHDVYQYAQRGRRFINFGTVNALVMLDQRKPFFDNKIMELIYSIPDTYRVNNRLYAAMLQQFFPEYFKDIPWQNTGKPAAKIIPPTVFKRAVNKLVRIAKRVLRVKSQSDKGYTDYPNWIRDEQVSRELTQILGNEDARYKALTKDNLVEKYLKPHLANNAVNNSEKILRAATVEIYLQHVLGMPEVTS